MRMVRQFVLQTPASCLSVATSGTPPRTGRVSNGPRSDSTPALILHEGGALEGWPQRCWTRVRAGGPATVSRTFGAPLLAELQGRGGAVAYPTQADIGAPSTRPCLDATATEAAQQEPHEDLVAKVFTSNSPVVPAQVTIALSERLHQTPRLAHRINGVNAPTKVKLTLAHLFLRPSTTDVFTDPVEPIALRP